MMSIEKQVQAHMNRACFYQKGQTILVAVSGGLDSMVLCHLLAHLEIPFGMAHMNYQLRGEESEGDAQFVKTWAKDHSIPYFEKRHDMAGEAGNSVQMEARTARYQWLESLRLEHQYDWIATGHHADDSLETMLLQFTRGMGLAAWSGIRPQAGRIIRPLLIFSREDLRAYVEEKDISFREDSSNATDHYRRNKIRHHVVPVLKTMNPSLLKTFLSNADLVADYQYLSKELFIKYKKKWLKTKKGYWEIPLKNIQRHPAASTILFELLKDFDFKPTVIRSIYEAALGETSGQVFHSTSHRLMRERMHLVIAKQASEENDFYIVEKEDKKVVIKDYHLNFEEKRSETYAPESYDAVALLAIDKISFPLTIRRKKDGDYFYPKGLLKASGKPGKKKLKNYCHDQKMSVLDKENLWLLCDAEGHILWLIGHRQDQRFIADSSARRILRVKIKKRST